MIKVKCRGNVNNYGEHFEQLLWQYSAIWQETFQFLSDVTRSLDCFFNNHKFKLLNFARYGGKYYMDFVGNLLLFPWVRKNWKSVQNWQSVSLVYYFYGRQCTQKACFCWLYHVLWLKANDEVKKRTHWTCQWISRRQTLGLGATLVRGSANEDKAEFQSVPSQQSDNDFL